MFYFYETSRIGLIGCYLVSVIKPTEKLPAVGKWQNSTQRRFCMKSWKRKPVVKF